MIKAKRSKVEKSPPTDPVAEKLKRRGVGSIDAGSLDPSITSEHYQQDLELLEKLRQCLPFMNSRERDYKLATGMIQKLAFASDEERAEAQRIIDVFSPGATPSQAATSTSSLLDLNGKQLLERIVGLYEQHGNELDADDFRICKSIAEEGEPVTGPAARNIAIQILNRFLAARQVEPAKAESKPRNGKQAQPAAPAWGPLFEVDLTLLDRHPINREPTEADIAERAASIQKDGQLEPLRIRTMPKGRFQILSGETRVLAGRKLGLQKMEARAIACDDAQALIFLADFNGHRTDLNPIQKARLIVKLCEPREKGGSGLTRDEAAAKVGIESAGGVSNLVRLLDLPKAWQDRVSSGELPQSMARLILQVREIPGAMKDLEQKWKKRDKAPDWDAPFRSRNDLDDEIDGLLNRHTRAIDHSNYNLHGTWIKVPSAEIDKHRAKLGCITLPAREGDEGPREVATNVALFTKLYDAAIEAERQKQAKRQATKAGKRADAGVKERPKTKAELKAAAEKREQQLDGEIKRYRETLVRRAISAKLTALEGSKDAKKAHPKLIKLLLYFFVVNDSCTWEMEDLLKTIVGEKTKSRFDVYELLTRLSGPTHDCIAELQGYALELCRRLVHGDGGIPQCEMSDDELASVCKDWGGDLADQWQRLQAAKDPFAEEFFQFHRKDELIAVGKELGVFLQESQGKPEMIKQLLNRPAPLKLPKCLELPPAKKGGK